MKTILLAFTAATCLPALAATVTHTFRGVTTSNVVDPGAVATEFPVGTKWIVTVDWDTAGAPLFTSDTQGQYQLSRFTVTLEGKTGTWTTSSLANKASFTLNKLGSHEIQFTSGWGPGNHTNQTIEDLAPYSVNVTLKDPTGKVLSGLTPAPTGIDLSKWNVETSDFKIYLSDNGFMKIQGSLTPPTRVPDISVQQPAGSQLADGSSKKSFGTAKLGKKGVSKTFTIKNTGSAPLNNLAVALTGKHKKDFKVTAPSKTSLAPGASTTFKVTFKPKTKGTRNALLQISSNDKDENPFDITVTGLAVE